MLGQRVARLEEDVREIRTDVRAIRDDIADLKERFARMEGGFDAMRAEIRALPTVWIFVVTLIGSVIAAVAVAVSLTP